MVEGSAVEAFIAGVRSLTESRLEWWQALAPGVSAPAPLVGAKNPSYLTSLQVTVSATGTQPDAVTLTDVVELQGGSAPGRYAMTVDESVRAGKLVIASWGLAPA